MKIIYSAFLCFLLLLSCKEAPENNKENETYHTEDGLAEVIQFSDGQVESLDLGLKPIQNRNMGSGIEVTGVLKVPPQHEAVVTGVLGGNVSEINVRVGDSVRKNQVLAFMSHPDLVNLQSAYLKAYNELEYLEKEYQRQKKLYDEGIAAGKVFNHAENQYIQTKGEIQALEAQLKLMNLNPASIRAGRISEKMAITSPISGFVQAISVRTGQYLEPQTTLFEIINPKEIYAELKVYERELVQMKIDQTVEIALLDSPDEVLQGKVKSIGKAFGSNPKAVNLIATFDQVNEELFPGMYVKGRIRQETRENLALPDGAVVSADDKNYVFIGKHQQNHWSFKAVQVKEEMSDEGWSGISFLEPVPENALFVHRNAYYILAEAQKGMGGDHH